MSLIINHNISALNTHRNITGSGESMAKSIEKLSSGYKINVGADDPSGLIISEQLRSQISGLERAVRNSSEAFNLIGIAEGALNEMNTILKKMRALAIHAANSGVTSPEQVSADQSEMDSGIETLNRIANTTRYSDQYLLNGQKQLVYDVNTSVNEPTDHALLDTKMTRIDQVFKRDGVKMAIGFAGEKSQYQANTSTSAQRAYLETDNAYSLCEVDGASVTAKQEFILTGTSGSRMFSFAAGAHLGSIVESINNVRDSTGIGASLTFASDVRIDETTGGTREPRTAPDYQNNKLATPIDGYDGVDANGNEHQYIYQNGDVQIYGAGLNNQSTAKISEFSLTPDAASSFKVGYNCDGDGKIYAKVVDKSTNSIEYYKDKECTMLVGKGDDGFFSATNNSGIPSSPVQNLDGIFMKLNSDNAEDLDVYEIAVVGQRLDNQKDMDVNLAGWADTDNSVMSGVNLGINTSSEGSLYYEYVPRQFEADGKTVKTFEVNVYKHESREPKYLVATSGIVENNLKIKKTDAAGNITQIAGQTVRLESVVMEDGNDSGLNITINLPRKGILDDVTGQTVDEIKASDEYKKLMEELSVEKSAFAEVEEDYTKAKNDHNSAIADLDTAMKALDNARKQEEAVRREIDRLEARDIDQQLLDANRDLELSQNDLIDAARDVVATKENDEAYIRVNIAYPGAPETIAEQVANAVLEEIEVAITNRGQDPATIDWDGKATTPPNTTVKDTILATVWGKAPLNTLTPAERAAVQTNADQILDDAYAAATNLDLVKEVRDNINTVDQLDGLEAAYKIAGADLADAKTDLDDAVRGVLNTVSRQWYVEYTPGGAATKMAPFADDLRDELTKFIDTAAADPDVNFMTYNWPTARDGIVADAVAAAVAAGGSFAGASAEEQAQLTAIASDMFDALTERPGSTEFAEYGEARQKLNAATPDPTMDLALQGEIAGDVSDEMTREVSKAALGSTLETIGTNWAGTNSGKYGFADLSTEIAAIIQDELNDGTGGSGTKAVGSAGAYANYYTEDDLNDGTFKAAVLARIQSADGGTSPALNVAIDLGGDGFSNVAATTNNMLGNVLDAVWDKVIDTSSPAMEFAQGREAYNVAYDEMTAATTALGAGADAYNVSPVGYAAADATNSMNLFYDEVRGVAGGGINVTGPLEQDIADAFAAQLLELAKQGIDVSDSKALLSGNNPALIINGIIDGIDPALLSDATTLPPTVMSERILKQYITEVFNGYVSGESLDPAGTGLLAPVAGPPVLAGAPGEYSKYTELVDTFAKLDAIYPGGGAIQRAEDREARYLKAIEDAPFRKTQNGAATRKAWQRLIEEYGPTAGKQLQELAEDFGKYVRDKVESAAIAGTESSIVWNSDASKMDVLDWLSRQSKGDGLTVVPQDVDPADGVTPKAGATADLWDDIQAKLAPGTPDSVRAQGEADLADFMKIVDRMFTSVTNPEYIGDEDNLTNPPPDVVVGDYVPKSPVQKYFDQHTKVEQLTAQWEAAVAKKDGLDDVISDILDGTSSTPPLGDLVIDLQETSKEFGIVLQEAQPILDEITRIETEAKEMLAKAGGAKVHMPEGNQTGSVDFTNLGMRIYAVDYGSAETIRIQNKAGNLFYQYREPDSAEKLMVKPDVTVQTAGQDAQISLNGAPVFTTGLVADTTTPDFSGSLVFNAGTLGETTLAVAGYDVGKLFSKAGALQGVEENEADISELRRQFEPPSMTVPMGDDKVKPATGMLNKTGKPVSLYMDFSQLDPSVEVKVDNFGNPCPVEAIFTAPDQLTINASTLGTDPDNQMSITVKVAPDSLDKGYYITEPALKGLFIRTDDLVDLNMSGADYTPPVAPSTTPMAGNTMLEVSTYATNPRSNTSESMENFIGGMQFQLGNTEGDQDRTVYSIQSMAMSELGRISWNGQEYCLQNVLGGGLASLSKDPILAMRVLEQAVDDVSNLRARLGAFQSNMLQSNINSLGVAVENITKTESAIRDTDMAAESTQFTRFQIMQQAGTSMLAQANQVSQNVLSLLQ